MNNKDLEGIKVCGTELKISQFADDRSPVKPSISDLVPMHVFQLSDIQCVKTTVQ